jgi:hypothetical protein
MNKPNQSNDKSTDQAADLSPVPMADTSAPRWGVIDIRLLRVIVKFNYMFQGTKGPLVMADDWIAPFAATSTEIDQLLGDDKRGFHWQQLGHEGDRVDWYWALGEDYAPSLVMYRDELAIDFRVVNSPMDPENTLRDGIRAIVLRGEANARKQFKAKSMGGNAA